MTLGPPTSASPTVVEQRPFQRGRIIGKRGGADFAVEVDWLIDTGAEISTVWDSVGAAFDTQVAVGVTASPTTGGGGIQVVTGLTAEFTGFEGAFASARQLQARGLFGIKDTDASDNLLGMEQIALAGATIVWDPERRRGWLGALGPARIVSWFIRMGR